MDKVKEVLKAVESHCCYELVTGTFCSEHIGREHKLADGCVICSRTSFNEPRLDHLLLAIDRSAGEYMVENGQQIAVTQSGLIILLEDVQVESNYLDYTNYGVYNLEKSLEDNLLENPELLQFAHYHLVVIAG